MSFCDPCALKKICKKEKISCKALSDLYKICDEEDMERKRELIIQYAKDLDIVNFEVSPEVQQLGEKVIATMPDLQFISTYNIKIGYLVSYEHKRNGTKIIHADCRKIANVYTAYLPFHFIVTFYLANISYMTENQQKLLMYHELRHIGVGPKGLRIEPHDIEDFESIVKQYGMNWGGFGNDVPDILAGGGGDMCKWHQTAN